MWHYVSCVSTIEYRKAELADVPRLVSLPQPGEAGGDRRMLQYLAGQHHPQQALPPRVMWMATEKKSPIGYIAGHLTTRFGCDGELQWIYIIQSRRRLGVASSLLHHMAQWFVEHEARRVCVDVGDDNARPFYRRHGAVDLSRHWMVWDDIGRAVKSRPTA